LRWSTISVSLAFFGINLTFDLVTFCCCCCRGHALKPLAPLALIAFILLGVAVAVFAIKNKEALGRFQLNSNFKSYLQTAKPLMS
jgi:hypothetical protein